jgi:hypothetical protein
MTLRTRHLRIRHPARPRAALPALLAAALPALLAALLLPAAAHAQSIPVRGTVTHAETGVPIANAQIMLRDAAGGLLHETRSDSVGVFRLEAAGPGGYELSALSDEPVASGSRELELAAGDDVLVEIRLTPRTFELEAITVVARRAMTTERVLDFRRRAEFNRALGRGRIYTREDIDALHPRSAESLLGTVPMGRCVPDIRLDGVPASPADLRSITPEVMEGMEVYMGLQIPREFEAPGRCGVILVWTRSQPEGMREMSVTRALLGGFIAALTFYLMR